MEFGVNIEPILFTGAARFNDKVHQQLDNAQEEVKLLMDANCVLLLERTLNNDATTADSVDANMYATMYEHVLQGKDKRAT
jgi:hypothetical protein